MSEGHLKYRCDWRREAIQPSLEALALIEARQALKALGLVGVYPDGIGFGNVSARVGPGSFLITGTRTGHLDRFDASHLALVDAWDLGSNSLSCRGETVASSESLSHAAIYDAGPGVRAVAHAHCERLWRERFASEPATPEGCENGTVAMARAFGELVASGRAKAGEIIVMRGHSTGLLTFGASSAEVTRAFAGALRR